MCGVLFVVCWFVDCFICCVLFATVCYVSGGASCLCAVLLLVCSVLLIVCCWLYVRCCCCLVFGVRCLVCFAC